MNGKSINKTISIVIPTFNRQHLIVDALESCKKQTYRPLEVIVVDDGSQDQTNQIVNIWKSKNENDTFKVKYIYQTNSGGNVARNNGIQNAENSLIAFLDSDDLWEKTKLKKQVEIIESDQSIGAVYCGLREVEIESEKVLSDQKRIYAEGNILSQMLIRDVTGPTSTFLVRKSVFDHVGLFDENLQARQDWDMWIRIAEKYKIKAVRENLIDLRHHSGIRTASNPMKEINAFIRIRKKYEHLLMQQSRKVQKEAKANFFKRLGRVHLHHKLSKTKALLYYLKSILIYPKDFDNWAALIGFFIPKHLRKYIHNLWNGIFSKTKLSIRSH